jgi:hypothetical protein
MLRFRVFDNGRPASAVNIESAYLVGVDRVPLRGKLEFADGEIRGAIPARGAAGLSLMWPVEGAGRMMMETTRLLDRPRPYNLHVELARGQLMRISQKREDWGLYAYRDGQEVYREIEAARDLLIDAITTEDEAAAAKLGDAALGAAVKAGERMGLFHADGLLEKLQTGGQPPESAIGCVVDVTAGKEAALRAIERAFAFAHLRFDWRTIEPTHGKPQFGPYEDLCSAFRERNIRLHGTLLSFDESRLPPWVRTLARNYDHLREAIAKHLKQVLKQFQGRVASWEVVSGIHARNACRLSFDQIMELTRMATILARQLAPQSQVLLGIVLPWGEYYSHDSRTIPPMLYAQTAVESGINFDAFSVDLCFGGHKSGRYVRDLLQVSAMLDSFIKLGKPLHITTAGVPSSGEAGPTGCWRDRWTEPVQAQWAHDFYRIVLSKPFVHSVTWQALTDAPDGTHAGGLLHADFSRKPAWDEVLALRPLFRAAAVAEAGPGAET